MHACQMMVMGCHGNLLLILTKYPMTGASRVTARGVTPMMTPVTNTEAPLPPACVRVDTYFLHQVNVTHSSMYMLSQNTCLQLLYVTSLTNPTSITAMASDSIYGITRNFLRDGVYSYHSIGCTSAGKNTAISESDA